MSRKKVTVVGGGFVGSTTAQRIVDLELADVVLTDILDGPPAGKALDIVESRPITRTDSHATGISTASGDYSATAGSDVVVICVAPFRTTELDTDRNATKKDLTADPVIGIHRLWGRNTTADPVRDLKSRASRCLDR